MGKKNKKRKERGGEIEKKNIKIENYNQGLPSPTVYLYPFNPLSETPTSTFNEDTLKEEYIVLANYNRKSCVGKPMPKLKYICTSKTPKAYRLYPSRILDTSTLNFHARTTNRAACPYNLRHSSAPDHSNQLQHHNNNSYLSNLGDFDEGSEANRTKFATIALNCLDEAKTWNPALYKGKLGLVECGPIALGHSSDGLILHFNFKARNIEATDTSVETYFAELIKSDTNDIQPVCVRCLGPSSSLPDEAKTFGCLYCSSHNIHHPDVTLNRYPSFHNGREDCWTTLLSQSLKLLEFRKKKKSLKVGISCMFSHPGLEYFDRYYHETPNALAAVALSLFNSRTNDTYFQLVKLGSSIGSSTAAGLLVHLNFEAKNKCNPDAPVQTFFAEVVRSSVYIFATFCECLGPSDTVLPQEPNKHGCTFCVRARVHHPLSPGYINGGGFKTH